MIKRRDVITLSELCARFAESVTESVNESDVKTMCSRELWRAVAQSVLIK